MNAPIENGLEITPEVIRSRIMDFERVLASLPQIEIKAEHFFTPGICVRQIFIPKGTLMTGAVYRDAHVHLVLSGEMTVVTEEGLKRVKGPHTFVASPGMKRVGYAHEDTTWAAVFRTDETDPEKIIASLTVETFANEGAESW